MSAPINQLCQIEIPVGDLTKAAAFYAAAFGWQTVPAEIENMLVLDVPEDCPYGVNLVQGRKDQASAPRGRAIYIRVDGAKDIAARAEAAGATMLFGPKKIPGLGVAYQLRDLDGHVWGLFEGRDPVEG